jgi:hypothetical protein
MCSLLFEGPLAFNRLPSLRRNAICAVGYQLKTKSELAVLPKILLAESISKSGQTAFFTRVNWVIGFFVTFPGV